MLLWGRSGTDTTCPSTFMTEFMGQRSLFAGKVLAYGLRHTKDTRLLGGHLAMAQYHKCNKCSQEIKIRRYPKTAGPYVFVWHKMPNGALCPKSGRGLLK